MQSIAQWQSRHTPQYMIAVEKLQAQRQMAHEIEDKRYYNQIDIQNRQNSHQWDLMQYKENQAMQRENEKGRMALEVERERSKSAFQLESEKSKNRLAELEAELNNKIQTIGVEMQVAMAMKIVEQIQKNKDSFRNALEKRADFRADMHKAILNAIIAKKQGIGDHAKDLEKMRLEAELRHRKEEIDELTKKALAYGEVVAKREGDEAGAQAVNDLVAKWEASFS
jgi:hypothetical protein